MVDEQIAKTAQAMIQDYTEAKCKLSTALNGENTIQLVTSPREGQPYLYTEVQAGGYEICKDGTCISVYALNSEVLSFSDDQLYQYIKTMKYCGFTGIQVTDMCSAWAAYGGPEFVHERLRYMADVSHSLDMKFTLWVWAAEFTGYGWVDNMVSYYDKDLSEFAYENPQALATFDKYYSIYAELADCSDRVIAHFHDSGNLET